MCGNVALIAKYACPHECFTQTRRRAQSRDDLKRQSELMAMCSCATCLCTSMKQKIERETENTERTGSAQKVLTKRRYENAYIIYFVKTLYL